MKRMVLIVGLLALISSVAAFEQAAAESRQIPSKSSAEKESAATSKAKSEKIEAGTEKDRPSQIAPLSGGDSRRIPSKSTTDKEPAPTSEVTPERSEAGQSGSSPGSESSREVPSAQSRSSEMKKDKPVEKEADTGY